MSLNQLSSKMSRSGTARRPTGPKTITPRGGSASRIEIKQLGPGRGRGVCATSAFSPEETVFSEKPLAAMQTLPNRFEVLSCGYQCCIQPIEALGTQLALLAGQTDRAELSQDEHGGLGVRLFLDKGGDGGDDGGDASGSDHGHDHGAHDHDHADASDAAAAAADAQEGKEGAGEEEDSEGIELLSGPVVWCSAGCGEAYCSEKCRADAEASGHYLLCTGHITEEEAEGGHPLLDFKRHAVQVASVVYPPSRSTTTV